MPELLTEELGLTCCLEIIFRSLNERMDVLCFLFFFFFFSPLGLDGVATSSFMWKLIFFLFSFPALVRRAAI